jgi:hypothetical protein
MESRAYLNGVQIFLYYITLSYFLSFDSISLIEVKMKFLLSVFLVRKVDLSKLDLMLN